MSYGHTPEDPLPAMIAMVDQLAMQAPLIARAAHAFYTGFAEAGFKESQALYLTACQLMQHPGSAP